MSHEIEKNKEKEKKRRKFTFKNNKKEGNMSSINIFRPSNVMRNSHNNLAGFNTEKTPNSKRRSTNFVMRYSSNHYLNQEVKYLKKFQYFKIKNLKYFKIL